MPPMNASMDDASMALSQPLREHLHSLRAHLGQCHHAQGPMFALGCLAERVHGLAAGRFVTMVVLAVAMLPLASFWS